MKHQKKIRKIQRRTIEVIQLQECLDSWVNTNQYLLSKFEQQPICSEPGKAPGSMLDVLLQYK